MSRPCKGTRTVFTFRGVYQLGRWRLGTRWDRLGLFADRFKRAGVKQDLGETPWRASGAVEFNPSEFTRMRLQYTHDRSAGGRAGQR